MPATRDTPPRRPVSDSPPGAFTAAELVKLKGALAGKYSIRINDQFRSERRRDAVPFAMAVVHPEMRDVGLGRTDF
jgi:hypothetical protein